MAASSSVLSSKRAGFVGLGRLGLCTALKFEEAGWDIVGSDVFPSYVESINAKTLKSTEPGVEDSLRVSSRLRATLHLKEVLDHADIIFILVATPTGVGDEAYDTSTLSRVLRDIARLGPTNKHIVICCTVMPGYIATTGSYLLEGCKGCTLSYNPEFIAQGVIMEGLSKPDVVLIGEGSPAVGEILQRMYEDATSNEPRICRMSPASAEIMKLSVNCFVTTKISFANMIGDIADATPGADKMEILRAVGGDSRVGSKCILPGYGFGGPCFPRDNRALGTYARMVGVEPEICDATDRYNKFHAGVMAKQLLATGKDRHVISDVAYKPCCPVDIIEESQPIEVAKHLVRAGKAVTIRDRHAIVDLVKRTHGRIFSYEVSDEGARESEKTQNPTSSYKR
jgi:nucleotide sugar dehydrogenase|tara:strand:+ start:299 stop:1489 length:1191 start_codon:yes stop_codon:yes gene_type:complete